MTKSANPFPPTHVGEKVVLPKRKEDKEEEDKKPEVDTAGESPESKAQRSVDEIRQRILKSQPKEK